MDALPEKYDADEVMEEQMERLVEMVEQSRKTTFFLGAGISRSAGIPTYRGKDGIRTKQGRRKKKKRGGSMKTAVPTAAHRAILELMENGYAHFVATQNLDGLERKTGIHPSHLAELHGNRGLERCLSCGKEYIRDYRARNELRVHVHTTGRKCVCGTELVDSIINFDEPLHEPVWDAAEDASESSDLIIVLGSSLTVEPAASLVAMGKQLVIVNLQDTPYDDEADLRIFAETDRVMTDLVHALGLTLRPWVLERRVSIRHGRSARRGVRCVSLRAQDEIGTAVTMCRYADFKIDHPRSSRRFFVRTRTEPFIHALDASVSSALASKTRAARILCKVRLMVYGNMGEPDVVIDHELVGPSGVRHYLLVYSPADKAWSVRAADNADAMPGGQSVGVGGRKP